MSLDSAEKNIRNLRERLTHAESYLKLPSWAAGKQGVILNGLKRG
jgi:hypothetical protein